MVKVSSMFVFTAVLLAGCGGSTPEHNDPQGAPPTSRLGDGWTSISPGGDTLCSDGSDYQFFARQGDPSKLVVYLQGGGACWFRENCDPEMQPTYTIRIGEDFTPWEFGIFNFSNPDNPFKDHSVVFAPYCSADVHLGQNDTVYPPVEEGQEPLTIYHRGRANMQAVLNWTFEHFPKPENVFVTGSSAGAIPSPFYAVLVANHYQNANVAQLGDGAGGYRRVNSDTRPDEQWGTFNFINNERGFEDMDRETFNYERLYITAAKARPDILFAEYDAAEDDVQKRFLALSGTRGVSLLDALRANHADIRAEVDNFRSFIAGGTSHTVLQRPEFYAYGANGVGIRDWVAELAALKPVADLSCADCTRDTYITSLPAPMQRLWDSWEDQDQQYVEPFRIFDNVYYVGIDWVAAYLIDTGEGLILIDSLYGKWVRPLVANISKLGFNPADVKYVINTHGHFDHAGGSAFFQKVYGSRVVMTKEDWDLTAEKPDIAQFYMPVPQLDIVATDGDVIELGDTQIELFNTPGHTEGVLTLRYKVRDGDIEYTAVTLGGVGLNFSGVVRTESYIASYERLQSIQDGVSVSLPNHARMAGVFARAEQLAARKPGDPHPFVDPEAYKAGLATFIANARTKLDQEKAGTAPGTLEVLTSTLSD